MNPINGLINTNIGPNLIFGKDQQFPIARVVSETLLNRIPSDLHLTIRDYVDEAWKMEDEENRILIKSLGGINLRIFAPSSNP
jgi:hypothetical protein